jgi:dihydroxyacetone kinase-like protein
MAVGMGIHGEAGLERRPLGSADAVADELLDLLLEALQPAAGEHVAVLVNSFGATPAMEGYVVVRRVLAGLRDRGLPTHRARVGEYVTSLEMAGLSVTLAALDADLRALIDAPASPLAAPTLAPPW